jgi:hypothetical protein
MCASANSICQPPFLPRNFKQEVGGTRVHGPTSQMSSAMFLFIVKFSPGKYDFDQYKGFSMAKTA